MIYEIYEEPTANDVSGFKQFLLADPADETIMESIKEFGFRFIGTVKTDLEESEIMNGFTAVLVGENIRLRSALSLIRKTLEENT